MSYCAPLQHPAPTIIKSSDLHGEQPCNLAEGEIAVNTADGRLYVKTNGQTKCLTMTSEQPMHLRLVAAENRIMALETLIEDLIKRIPSKTWLESEADSLEQ